MENGIIMAEETFKYKSTDVALLMMGRAAENRILMNYTKIQKFLFILYTLYLTSQGHRLTDESPKAWPFGPVFPTVKKKLEKWNVNIESFNLDDYRDKISDQSILTDENLKGMCDSILTSNFGKMSANQLVAWTHTPGAPWDITTKKPDFKWNDPITDDLIEAYYGKSRN